MDLVKLRASAGRSSAWTTLVRTPMQRNSSNKSFKLRRLALNGIPDDLRSTVYPWLLTPATPIGLYNTLQRGVVSDVDIAHTIKMDAIRAIPEDRNNTATVNSESLERVLTAYAVHKPEVGYTQGMSNIAYVILRYSSTEDMAFECFTSLMDLLNYTEVFRPGFPLLLEWMRMFENLMDGFLPGLRDKLARKGITSELYIDKWFLTALTYNFPEHVFLRMWDMMLADGTEKILFRAGIALLQLGEEKRVYDRGFEEIIRWLQCDFAQEYEMSTPEGSEMFVRRVNRVNYKRSKLLPENRLTSPRALLQKRPLKKRGLW